TGRQGVRESASGRDGRRDPHRWIAWTAPNDLLARVDWGRSTFVIREQDTVDQAAGDVRSFRERAEFEDASKRAFERWASIDLIEIAWSDPAPGGLDLFVIPLVRVDATYVSRRLAHALLGRPKLTGFRILTSDGSRV
ncbi:MAG: hypothetical protein WCJ30_03300, partial [Deltaproteobacteria bacterium]